MKTPNSSFRILPSSLGEWLPDMDLNHDKQIQSLLCYRYTIGQAGAADRLTTFPAQSSRQTGVPAGRAHLAPVLDQRRPCVWSSAFRRPAQVIPPNRLKAELQTRTGARSTERASVGTSLFSSSITHHASRHHA
jgi:hypothetical protein